MRRPAWRSRLGQRRAASRFQRRAQGGAIEAGRVGVFLHRLALHEQPLAGVDRVERARSRAPAPASPPRCRTAWRRSRRDAGQAPRPGRSRPSRQRIRRGARCQQAGVQASVLGGQMIQERAVEPDQPVALRQVGEREPEAKWRQGKSVIASRRGASKSSLRQALASFTPGAPRAVGEGQYQAAHV